MQKIKIGPIEYDKEEERKVAESIVLGFSGIPVGFFVAISYGLFERRAYEGPLGWLVAYTPLLGTTFASWWLTTIISSIILWWANHRMNYRRDLERALFPALIIPGLWLYLSLLFAFIFDPLNHLLLQYYSPVQVYWIGALVFFPFSMFFVYMVIPSLRVRMRSQLRLIFTDQFWRESWRESWKDPKSRKEIVIAVIFIAINLIILLEPLFAA